MQILQ